ncbi:MAG: thioredoxin [Dehalococcoidia bacterium]|jgi:thiol-disulfide isomerase/thioredoxin
MENLTKETFKEKVFDFETETEWKFKGSKPAVIDFYADWCGPCKMVAPVLEKLSTEHPEIDFYKVDTEVQAEIAAAFQIRSIPMILFIPLEGQPGMAIGALPKEKLEIAIKDILKIE